MTTNGMKLNGISDIRRFFQRNETPIYFISATNFNLLGADEWVKSFKFINYLDCFDGQHPNVLVPIETPHDIFESIEEINNYLLEHKEVADYIAQRGGGGKVLFLMFDGETEALAEELGLEVCFPPAKLRTYIDNKVTTTRIANEAGVDSVPNVLAKVDSYETLLDVSEALGSDLVVQTPFGDSGHTTFFISNEEEWEKYAEEIIAEPEVKVMKRINCRGSAMEACVTRNGTIVGPLMTELVGFKELTPYKGGWCGNEIYADTFTPEIRRKARESTYAVGEQLKKEGYRGYFEIDFLLDIDSNDVYLGEINPRVTGASSITNHAVFALADAPLFMFHLLEWMDVDFELDVQELNERWAKPENIDDWGQLVIKHTEDTINIVTKAPPTGIWQMDDHGHVSFSRYDSHRRAVESEHEAFFLRITGVGDYQYEGADLGILVTRGRLMTDDFQLNDRAKAWINGIRAQYSARPPIEFSPQPEVPAEIGSFKML
ncbi:MAG TPA: biotin carboxylase [Anaerolineae bacterium]|nr:biotin carboxylase [Anaerolineales bacterium]HRV95420.1 biotin carboxylase [Anaerolineae bacterium]